MASAWTYDACQKVHHLDVNISALPILAEATQKVYLRMYDLGRAVLTSAHSCHSVVSQMQMMLQEAQQQVTFLALAFE